MECVREGRTGGREDGADTELKTKTPHVNVGPRDARAYIRPLGSLSAHCSTPATQKQRSPSECVCVW